jgi:ATP-binding cassette subfamily C protein
MLHKDTLGFLRFFMKAHRRGSAVIIGGLLAAGLLEGLGLSTLLPLLQTAMGGHASTDSTMGRIVERAFALLGLQPRFGFLLAFTVLAMTVKSATTWLAMRQVGYTIARVSAELRLALIGALLRARWGYFSNQPVGTFAHSISLDVNRTGNAYYEACLGITQALQAVIYAALAFLVSWKVATVAFLVGAMLAIGLRRMIALSRAAGRRQTELGRSLVAGLTSALQGIKPVKAMAREELLLPLLEDETQGLNHAQRQLVLAHETLKAVQEVLLVGLVAAGLSIAVTLNVMSMPMLMVMLFLFYRMVTKINLLQQSYQKMVAGESAFWSVWHAIESAQAEREIGSADQRQVSLTHGIDVRAVEFAYVPGKPLLRGVSMTIPAGRLVALIGPSGSGKTTLADILIGLARPQSGDVFVDGIPLSQVDFRGWRHHVGYVPQEMFLFHGTVLSNITLGDPSVTRADVEGALEAAGAAAFVHSLPGRLDAPVGERGLMISGGERQRIAIARALVRRPSLLVLDEVTTALDPATEAGICATLRNLAGQVTIVAISHQPAITGIADIVYRIEDGRLQKIRG